MAGRCNTFSTAPESSQNSCIISTRFNSLNTSLNEQLSAVDLKIKNSAEAGTDLGIIGLKFKIESQKSPQVETIFPGTPAMMAHIQTGDIITCVNGILTSGLTKEDVYQMLIGVPNTKVDIAISGATRFLR